MVWALLPLKDFVNAKQRLSGVLSPHERRHFFHSMVEDVLAVLAHHEGIEKTVIVSDDPSAELLAEHYGVDFWPESSLAGSGLNAVVTAFARQIQQLGVDSLLVVHGDLPLLTGEQLDRLLASHSSSPGVTLAPDRHLLGSNCLLCSPPAVIDFHYGENSFQLHRQACERSDVVFSECLLDGVSCDVDNPEDILVLLQKSATDKKSVRYLKETGIAERLQAMSIGDGSAALKIDRDKMV